MPADHNFADFWENLTPGSIFFGYIFILIIIGAIKFSLYYCKFW